ncbi:DUF3280 domain-containing protein [Pelomicrobium sp.]|jgi:hypothetical protein|uniref:DUF3280 domain-containing protein n=1 Tax=Pelomicrobium sp. TaxID=2815319 RepID=UPI002FDF01DF
MATTTSWKALLRQTSSAGLALLLLGGTTGGDCAPAEPVKSIAVMDFEMIDDSGDEASVPAQRERLKMISRQLREELAQAGLCRVLDNGPAQVLIDRFRASQALRQCNGCERDIGKALGADLVALTWVQKVSNLILNINVEIKDVASGATRLIKSVDIRGNTDTSWRRGVSYLVRDMAEKGQGCR